MSGEIRPAKLGQGAVAWEALAGLVDVEIAFEKLVEMLRLEARDGGRRQLAPIDLVGIPGPEGTEAEDRGGQGRRRQVSLTSVVAAVFDQI